MPAVQKGVSRPHEEVVERGQAADGRLAASRENVRAGAVGAKNFHAAGTAVRGRFQLKFSDGRTCRQSFLHREMTVKRNSVWPRKYQVFKAMMTIRYAILCHAEDSNEILMSGEIELDESYFGGHRKGNRGRGAAGKVPVFGILTRGGKAHVEVVPNVQAQTLLGITVKKVRRGSIVYTDKYKVYDSLMCCGYRHLNVDHSSKFVDGKVHINGLEGFWSWAKERLFKHHGISAKNFPLYLKELEFRYNHRDESIFEPLVQFLSDLVPDPANLPLSSDSQRDTLPPSPASP